MSSRPAKEAAKSHSICALMDGSAAWRAISKVGSPSAMYDVRLKASKRDRRAPCKPTRQAAHEATGLHHALGGTAAGVRWRYTRSKRRCRPSDYLGVARPAVTRTNSVKVALIQLPHIHRRFRPATILRFEMPGERKASNTIR